MPSLVRSLTPLLFAVALVSWADRAFANSGGEGAGEKAAASSGEGEEGAKKGDKVPKETVEFHKKEARRNTLKSKIDEATKRFKDVSEAKARTTDKVKKQELANELIAINKELNGYVKEYETVRQELQLKYPGGDEGLTKRLLPTKERTVEEREQSSELDEQMTGLKGQIDKKYAPFNPPPGSAAAAEEPAHNFAPAPKEKPKRLRLVK